MERHELANKVVRSFAYGIAYKPTVFERIKRWLHITHPCSLHGRDKWCTNCPPYPKDET